MRLRNFYIQLILLFLTHSNFIIADPVSNPEISAKTGLGINNLAVYQHQQQQQQQQQQKVIDYQNAQLNSLNVYASNYDMIVNKQNQNQNDKFKPSYKLPEMETNFMPIRNGNSIAPDFASTLGTHAPLLMQYLPQTINEGGVQYLQLIQTRPLMVPIGAYLPSHTGVQSLAFHQHMTPSNSIDYTSRPLLSPLPINMPPPAPAAIVDVPAASPIPSSYGIQPYTPNSSHLKQTHRINRETKDRQILGPLNLNLNEYIPQVNTHQHASFNIPGRL